MIHDVWFAVTSALWASGPFVLFGFDPSPSTRPNFAWFWLEFPRIGGSPGNQTVPNMKNAKRPQIRIPEATGN
jgi:hypothetical protein